jgi:hypothetical protein
MGFLAHVLVKHKVLMFDPLSFMDNFNDRFFFLLLCFIFPMLHVIAICFPLFAEN